VQLGRNNSSLLSRGSRESKGEKKNMFQVSLLETGEELLPSCTRSQPSFSSTDLIIEPF
jgi:hypothetical protein